MGTAGGSPLPLYVGDEKISLLNFEGNSLACQ